MGRLFFLRTFKGIWTRIVSSGFVIPPPPPCAAQPSRGRPSRCLRAECPPQAPVEACKKAQSKKPPQMRLDTCVSRSTNGPKSTKSAKSALADRSKSVALSPTPPSKLKTPPKTRKRGATQSHLGNIGRVCRKRANETGGRPNLEKYSNMVCLDGLSLASSKLRSTRPIYRGYESSMSELQRCSLCLPRDKHKRAFKTSNTCLNFGGITP